MRLWSLHPKYLDAQGLVALWREALLARAVLRGATRGYRHHPQLHRFRAHGLPKQAISAYLAAIHAEAVGRGYRFDRSKVGAVRSVRPIPVTRGQIELEWSHLLRKLSVRSPDLFEKLRHVKRPACHPLLVKVTGPVADWEKAPSDSRRVVARRR